MLDLGIQVEGLDSFYVDLDKFTDRARRVFKKTRLAQRLRADFFIMNRKTFTTRANGTWARLSDRYRLYKERVRPGRGVLIFDGNLIRSLTRGGDPNAIFRVSGTGRVLELGTKDRKAGFHQTGTRRIPRRTVVRMDKRVAERWAKHGITSLTVGLFGT
jgi:hypothetical protein